MVGLHIYPHLSDRQRIWIHDLLVANTKENLNIKSELIAGIYKFCRENRYLLFAIHTQKDDIEVFLRDIPQALLLRS